MPLYSESALIPFSSDPIEPDDSPVGYVEIPVEEPQIPFSEPSFDERIDHIAESLRYPLRDGQVSALRELHEGNDFLLVARTGYGKTLIMTGFDRLFEKEGGITLIISPLKSIEDGQARECLKIWGNGVRPFVLNGVSNSVGSRRDIASGKYTHVWLSPEFAVGDQYEESAGNSGDGGKAKKPGKKSPRRKVTVLDGYWDDGTFSGVLQNPEFQRRLRLVAIDELHLCAKNGWGDFRPQFSHLSQLRAQLPDLVPVFGTTATLTTMNEAEIRASAGFRPDTIVLRTSIYREDIFLRLLPTKDPKSVCRQVINTAITEALASSTRELQKMIFFVKTVKETVALVENIGRWFRARGQAGVEPFVRMYHGQLTASSRTDIEERFERGEIRVLVSTVAYALGVNPPGVKQVVQWGRSSLEETLQKLGRGNRGGLADGEQAVFTWLPEARVVGPRASEIPLDQRRNTPLDRYRGRTRERYERENAVFSVADLSDSAMSDRGVTAARKRGALRKNAPDEVWREHCITAEESAIFNGTCVWQPLLKPFAEELAGTCDNCNRCRPYKYPLVELEEREQEGTEEVSKVAEVRKVLEKLAGELGVEEDSGFMRRLCPTPLDRVMNKNDRLRFAQSYTRVARGELLGWVWEKKYGLRVTAAVRQVLMLPPLTPGVTKVVQRTVPRARIQLNLPVETANITEPATPTLSRIPIRAIAPDARLTARGDASIVKHTKATSGRKRTSTAMSPKKGRATRTRLT